MGIDKSIQDISTAIMFDRRAQMFNNRWLPNQVEQTPYTMNSVSNYDRVDSPMGSAALTNPFADFGNTSPSRLLSDRLTSTDSSNDPDGPAMDNGNGTCQSPGLDSIYSDPAALGTPNSFIADQSPTSPDMFTGQRERLLSTSSAFTYSPYSPREDEPFPSAQNCNPGAPTLGRQASLLMVEEFFGGSEHTNNDSPLAYSEDSCLPPYPSPTFLAHFNASVDPALMMITSSQDEQFYATHCDADVPTGLQCGGSPETGSDQTSSNCNNNSNEGSNSQNQQSPASDGAMATNTSESTVVFLAPPPVAPANMSREGSNISDIITDSFPSNSLDASALMQDFLDNVPTQTTTSTTYTTLDVAPILAPSTNAEVNTVEVVAEPTPLLKSFTNIILIDENEKPSTSGKGENDVATVRRERNNAACRMSRKRRRDKKLALEGKVQEYTDENEALRKQIEQLEAECKRVKTTILSTMTNNVNIQR